MSANELVEKFCSLGLCGAPVFLDGGDEWPDSTGWYYSFSGSLSSIEDAILKNGRGYRRAGEVADNVCGPFAIEESAKADLAKFAEEESGREMIEDMIDAEESRRESARHQN